MKDRNQRAQFVGVQLVMFVVLFCLGFAGGVYAKFNGKTLLTWLTPTPIYQDFKVEKPEVLSILRSIDRVLAVDGFDVEKRKSIIEALHAKRNVWHAEHMTNIIAAQRLGQGFGIPESIICGEPKAGS